MRRWLIELLEGWTFKRTFKRTFRAATADQPARGVAEVEPERSRRSGADVTAMKQEDWARQLDDLEKRLERTLDDRDYWRTKCYDRLDEVREGTADIEHYEALTNGLHGDGP